MWKDSEKKWIQRKRGGDKIISRMYMVSPGDIELFHLRMLLLHVPGPKSFEDLRTYQGVAYPTFVAACHARGIASNDNEWHACLDEAKEINSPRQLRELFAFICAMNIPANALALWDEFKIHMSEDFARDHSEEIAFNRALAIIGDILLSHNLSCEQLGLPIPRYINIDLPIINFEEEELVFAEMYENANNEQRNIIDKVLQEVLYHNTGSNVFCLTAHAGCGKTFVQTALIHKLNSMNLQCIPSAFSGIASTLLIGGRTLHNVFKLPINLVENSVSSIKPNSSQDQKIKNASLFIVDETSMCPLYGLMVIDRLMKDICENDQLFGGKPILLCGDFRQTLPVISHGTRVNLIENCIKSWTEFSKFKKLTLTQNMRALPNEIEFVEFLRKLGDGELQTYPQYGFDIIEIPAHLIR